MATTGRPTKGDARFYPDMELSVMQLGQLLGYSSHRIRQLIADGVVPSRESGEYPMADFVQQYCAHLRHRARMRVGPDGSQTEKQRLEAAKAEKAELELARIRSNMVSTDEATKIFTSVGSIVRTRIMAVPTKIAPIVRTAKSDAEAGDIIMRALRDALIELTEEKSPTF